MCILAPPPQSPCPAAQSATRPSNLVIFTLQQTALTPASSWLLVVVVVAIGVAIVVVVNVVVVA